MDNNRINLRYSVLDHPHPVSYMGSAHTSNAWMVDWTTHAWMEYTGITSPTGVAGQPISCASRSPCLSHEMKPEFASKRTSLSDVDGSASRKSCSIVEAAANMLPSELLRI